MFYRYLPDEPVVVGIANLESSQITVNLLNYFRVIPSEISVYSSGVYSAYKKG